MVPNNFELMNNLWLKNSLKKISKILYSFDFVEIFVMQNQYTFVINKKSWNFIKG